MSQCITPFMVKLKNSNEVVPVPCNRCPSCLARRVSAWSFRLMQEEKISQNAWFLTMTYDSGHVPITRNGFMGLCKRDCQLFLKRLRKSHEGITDWPSIKYYLVGEYGGKTRRPHYHVIMFNVHVDKIQNAWNKGQIHYGKVSGASVGYTLKYMNKPPFRHHVNDDREPVFCLMSKGLGRSYVTDEMCKWHRSDLLNRVCCIVEGGKRVSMPRYYKDRIYLECDRHRIAYFFKLKHESDVVEAIEDNVDYFRDKAEDDMASFRSMDRVRDRGCKL